MNDCYTQYPAPKLADPVPTPSAYAPSAEGTRAQLAMLVSHLKLVFASTDVTQQLLNAAIAHAAGLEGVDPRKRVEIQHQLYELGSSLGALRAHVENVHANVFDFDPLAVTTATPGQRIDVSLTGERVSMRIHAAR